MSAAPQAADPSGALPSASIRAASAPPSRTETHVRLLDARQRRVAIDRWSGAGHSADRISQLASTLGVGCAPGTPGFVEAMVDAIAAFQLRTAPFSTEVNGLLDDRTQRDLAMLHPSLREADHPCRREAPPQVPITLSRAQCERARSANEAGGKLDEAWLRRLQRAWGGPSAEVTGRFDDATLQRIAWFQRSAQLAARSLVANGIVDEATREALDRAYAAREDGSAGWLPGCLLRWPGATDAQRAFLLRVYEVQRVRAAQTRAFVDVVEASPVEEGRTARADVADALGKLLASARAERAGDMPRTKADLQVVFGYRAATVQLAIWEYHFPDRYKAWMQRHRELPGGEHGADASLSMATAYAARTASPGYSLHNRGVAVDFACVTPRGEVIGPTGAFIPAWRRSWCLAWLERNAEQFGFASNPRIDEPWHWEFREAATQPGGTAER